ncbi:Beta-hexosaminidase 1 [Nymphaea thermarum]|nr:Beta-hexosaminidase 1 [Nymphaea thermarum]
MTFLVAFLQMFLVTAFLTLALTDGRIPTFKAAAHSGGGSSAGHADKSGVFLWPIPKEFLYGNETLTVDPGLSLEASGGGGNSSLIESAFRRYKSYVFKHHAKYSGPRSARKFRYDVSKLTIVVNSGDDNLKLGTDESYALYVSKGDGQSILQGATLEANTVYGALRGLETFSQLCTFNFLTKDVEIYRAPWHIQDEPRFPYRGLLLDTSRHFLPMTVIKGVIESMSYAKLNVLHWHIIDEQSFPLEVPSFPKLWNGAYTKWERYTTDDASEIVEGVGYPKLWPSKTCREPLDVSKNFTFDVISGILSDMRKIFPFELFHLGGDEVNTEHNMTGKDAYQYFVLKAQKIATSHGWNPVNWEETFNTFKEKLSPNTVVHNWLGPGVCPLAVAKGFKCIVSNQGVWYLDHLDVPWEKFYYNEPLEGIKHASQHKLVLGGEVCMWGETVDASDIQQTIWPRAAAAAERLWSTRESTSADNATVLPRLEYFRCLLNQRGVAAAPVTNDYGRMPPIGPGSCYEQ